jgi:DNA-3-methyladenine glycosylase II
MSPRPAGAAARDGAGMLSEADQHLRRADRVMRELIDSGGPLDPEDRRRGRPEDAYGVLVRSIVGQQLSTTAARTIWGRLVALFDGELPPPEQLAAADEELLRSAGLSGAKAAYLRDLAARTHRGELDLDRLDSLADEDVVAELIKVKGIGRWTAEMFLMFHLRRPDVISPGDLGLRRAIQTAYGLSELPGPREFERIADPWRPHRTLACLYLWRSLDNAPRLEPSN